LIRKLTPSHHIVRTSSTYCTVLLTRYRKIKIDCGWEICFHDAQAGSHHIGRRIIHSYHHICSHHWTATICLPPTDAVIVTHNGNALRSRDRQIAVRQQPSPRKTHSTTQRALQQRLDPRPDNQHPRRTDPPRALPRNGPRRRQQFQQLGRLLRHANGQHRDPRLVDRNRTLESARLADDPRVHRQLPVRRLLHVSRHVVATQGHGDEQPGVFGGVVVDAGGADSGFGCADTGGCGAA